MSSFFINNQFSLVLSLILIVSCLGNFYLFFELWQIKKKLKVFFRGSKASDLEEVLSREIKELRDAKKEIKELFRLVGVLAKISEKTIQKVGLVRFNPFRETGGDQSFSIALLDANDNGLVISGLFNREATRVYVKPMKNGQSPYPLSQEETKAIKQAGLNK